MTTKRSWHTMLVDNFGLVWSHCDSASIEKWRNFDEQETCLNFYHCSRRVNVDRHNCIRRNHLPNQSNCDNRQLLRGLVGDQP